MRDEKVDRRASAPHACEQNLIGKLVKLGNERELRRAGQLHKLSDLPCPKCKSTMVSVRWTKSFEDPGMGFMHRYCLSCGFAWNDEPQPNTP